MAAGRQILLTIFSLIFVICIVNSQKNAIELNEENWSQMLQSEWMVEFYAPWCPACKGLQPKWQEFASWSKDLGIKVGQVDVTTSPGLSGRFMVTALPTIFHVLNGEFRQYRGTRDKESFISFIEEKKWEIIEPVPSWKSPNSVQMSVVSSFFKLSQVLRAVHNQLMEDFGLPTWGSYLIFALATILLGALLGLILVCLIDFIYPPRSVCKMDKGDGKSKKSDKSSDNELDDDDIKDDLVDDATHTEIEENKSSQEIKNNQEIKSNQETKSNQSSPNIKKRKARKD